jgi:hypothetical protein
LAFSLQVRNVWEFWAWHENVEKIVKSTTAAYFSKAVLQVNKSARRCQKLRIGLHATIFRAQDTVIVS